MLAAGYGHENVVGLLIELRADVNKADNGGVTPLYWAARDGHRNVVEMLINGKADVNTAADDWYG